VALASWPAARVRNCYVIYLSDAEQAVRPGSVAGAVMCLFSPTVANYGTFGETEAFSDVSSA
jgi:hypothetical protein